MDKKIVVRDLSAEFEQLMKDPQLARAHSRVLNEPCKCGLEPAHKIGEHDSCCQICGGSHTERICPKNKEQEVR